MSDEQMACIAVAGVVGIYLLSLVIGFIWLHFTTEPKPKQNKSNKKVRGTK